MNKNHNRGSVPLDHYRSYLLLLARMHLDPKQQAKVEASDVVQQTLLEAHAERQRLPENADELCAWLRTALANNIRDRHRELRRQKRDMARERPLEAAFAATSQRLADHAATLRPSPSQQAMRAEELVRMAEALWQLSDSQRDAIVLHHLEGRTIGQTARQLGKTDAAIAGLLHRGLRQLRTLLDSTE